MDCTAAERQQFLPFVMMSGPKKFEKKLYAEITKMLADLYKSPIKMKHGLLRLADRW